MGAKQEKSSGAVLFRETNTRQFLLLDYGNNYWGFSKGIIENGENEQDAARREIAEETGILDVRFIEGFREEINYFYRRKGEVIRKTAVYFLARANTEKVTLSFEHVGYAWLPYDRALDRVTYKNSKNVLRRAEDFLKTHST